MNKGNRRDMVQYVHGHVRGTFAGSLPSARIKGFVLFTHTLSERRRKENLSSIAVDNLRLLICSPCVV